MAMGHEPDDPEPHRLGVVEPYPDGEWGWRAVRHRLRPGRDLLSGVGTAVAVGIVGVGLLSWWVGRTGPAVPVDQIIPQVTLTPTTAGPPDPDSARGGAIGDTAGDTAEAGVASTGDDARSRPATVLVHVAGAVARPGVYGLEAEARVVDAVERAGGALPDADLDQLNLASPIIDGMQIRVPRDGEILPPTSIVASAIDGADGRGPQALVDINRADQLELQTLPGIGPATAEAIVAWRSEHGGFSRVSDLEAVPGIGPAKLARLDGLVTVGP